MSNRRCSRRRCCLLKTKGSCLRPNRRTPFARRLTKRLRRARKARSASSSSTCPATGCSTCRRTKRSSPANCTTVNLTWWRHANRSRTRPCETRKRRGLQTSLCRKRTGEREGTRHRPLRRGATDRRSHALCVGGSLSHRRRARAAQGDRALREVARHSRLDDGRAAHEREVWRGVLERVAAWLSGGFQI